jgi:hypothetical protein
LHLTDDPDSWVIVANVLIDVPRFFDVELCGLPLLNIQNKEAGLAIGVSFGVD